MTPRRSSVRPHAFGQRRYVRRVLCPLLAGIAVAAVGSFAHLCWRIDQTGRIDESRPVDAIIVLGAGVNPDGSASEDTIERTRHGIDLYRAGLAGAVLFTGGRGPISASHQGRQTAIDLHVPPTAALAVEGPWETRSDAHYSAALMRDHGWHTALLVTHPLHCYRARLFFEHQGIEAYISPTGPVDAVPQPWRIYYTVREAIGVLWPHLGLPDWFTSWLQATVYGWD